MEKKRGFKEKLLFVLNSKPVIGAMIFIVLGISMVIASDVIVKEGSMTVEDDFNVSNVLFVNSATFRVGIGNANPSKSFEIDSNEPVIYLKRTTNNLNTAGVQFVPYGAITPSNNLWSAGMLGSENQFTLRWYNGTDIEDPFTVENSTPENTLYLADSGKVGIGMNSPWQPLTVMGESLVSIWAEKNISATGFITRTSVFNSEENAFDYVKDSSYYLDGTKIDHTKFYGYVTYETTDLSRPVEGEDGKVSYPYTTIEEGVSLDKEIDVLRQAVYELQSELCKKDNSYDFC